MKRHFPRRKEQHGSMIPNNHDELIPELITHHGMRMLDNVHRCRDAWRPERIR